MSGFWRVIVVIAALRGLMALVSGLEYDRGDFYATLPGAHVRTVNPALWHSPDLAGSSAFKYEQYLYGPTQFLTLYPLAFFDSYAELSRFLLLVYAALVLLTVGIMWRILKVLNTDSPPLRAAVFASTLLYLPLLQAYVQREFEVVLVAVFALALYAILVRREPLAGAALGYVTWFKFLPIVFLPYLIARRWRAAIFAFVLASLTVLAASHLLFDLRRFGPVVELADTATTSVLSAREMCAGWVRSRETRQLALNNTTSASFRWALCRYSGDLDWWVLELLFWGPLLVASAVVGRGFARATTNDLPDPAREQSRRMLEFSLVLVVCSGMFYGHYYYLSQLIVPLNVLLIRYLSSSVRSWPKLWFWVASYGLLTAFVVPPGLVTRLVGVEMWRLYMQSGVYLFGELILFALLVWEYREVTAHRRVSLERVADRTPLAAAEPRLAFWRVPGDVVRR